MIRLLKHRTKKARGALREKMQSKWWWPAGGKKKNAALAASSAAIATAANVSSIATTVALSPKTITDMARRQLARKQAPESVADETRRRRRRASTGSPDEILLTQLDHQSDFDDFDDDDDDDDFENRDDEELDEIITDGELVEELFE
eukprot:TRINITY_DN2184_c0_g2_i1.p1 TRINITY_DN2184_c0_g2~~TRINITY_DN2184_c0_g2_i1.p1  ORF type:complete len:169 (-),score=53.51 TRINITY_DN2184_c0_g2_i1:7-447(-)